MITKFKSQGIRDESTHDTVLVNDLGLHVDNMTVNEILSPVAVKGDLNVEGSITAQKLHVNELTADIRNERSSPLEFVMIFFSLIFIGQSIKIFREKFKGIRFYARAVSGSGFIRGSDRDLVFLGDWIRIQDFSHSSDPDKAHPDQDSFIKSSAHDLWRRSTSIVRI